MAAPEMDCPGDALLPNGTGHVLLSKGPIFLDVGRFGWFNLAFLSSGGHGTTQLPSEKLLSYSCETSKARIFQNFRDFPEFW